MQEQLDCLGEVQTESAGIQRAQIQKELWRIQDVMEGLSKHKRQRGITETGMAMDGNTLFRKIAGLQCQSWKRSQRSMGQPSFLITQTELSDI